MTTAHSGTAEAGARVEIFDNGVSLGLIRYWPAAHGRLRRREIWVKARVD